MNRVSDLRPIIKSAVKMLDFSFILFLANRFISPAKHKTSRNTYDQNTWKRDSFSVLQNGTNIIFSNAYFFRKSFVALRPWSSLNWKKENLVA